MMPISPGADRSKTLFKYRSDSPYTEAIFKSGLVRLSNAQQLNDPFECSLQSIPADWVDKHIHAMKQAQFQGLFEHLHRSVTEGLPYFGLPARQVTTFFNELRGQEFEPAYNRLRVFAENASGDKLSDPTAYFARFLVGSFLPEGPLHWRLRARY